MIFFAQTSTDNYVSYNISGTAHLIIANDSALNAISVSLNGSKEELRILPDESIELRDLNESLIYVKSYSAGNHANFRIIAYGNQSIIYSNEKVKQIVKSVPVPKSIKQIPNLKWR